MVRKHIQIQTRTLRQLLEHIVEGRFAIPKLQREFVWDGPKAAKLLDSIYRGMPIGVVLIWETPRSQRLYLRQNYHVLPPFNAHNGKVWFLIDGQQRVSVLHHVQEGSLLTNASGKEIDFSRVVFSLDNEEDGEQIRYRKPVADWLVPMRDVLHPQWRHRLGPLGKRQKARVHECRERILKYGIHLMFVKMPLGDIRECFLRINTQGMKITTADAIITRAEGLDLRDVRHEVRQHIDDGFGQIPEMPILFAMAAVRGGTEARGQALRQVIERLEREAKADKRLRKTLAKEWHRLGVCFGKAVDYLRQNFCVLSREYLYSDYMVAVLAMFFFWNGRGPSSTQREQLRKWFWATAVGSRYSGRSFLRCLPEDLKFFKCLARNGSARFSYRPEVDRGEARRAQYASRTGITAAFYCMMLRRRPVSILDDGLNEIPVDHYATAANRKDRHHIYPQAVLASAGVPASLYNSICNICLLTAEENQSIGSRRPRSYLGDVQANGTYFARKMSRHLIPVHDASGIWQSDVRKGFSKLLQERMGRVCHELEAEAGIRLFRREP